MISTFLGAIAPLAAPHQIGRSFGEGEGLEEALSQLARCAPLGDVRPMGSMVAVSLLAATADPDEPPVPGTYEPSDLDQVMGIDWARHDASTSLAGAARTFLAEHGDEGAPTWELWKRRDDVAAEFLCWHSVAYLRLITIGKLPPHEE